MRMEYHIQDLTTTIFSFFRVQCRNGTLCPRTLLVCQAWIRLKTHLTSCRMTVSLYVCVYAFIIYLLFMTPTRIFTYEKGGVSLEEEEDMKLFF